MLWWLFFIGPIALAIIFKCMTMTFNIGTSISKRRAKKDAEAVEHQVEIAARQQMAQFAAENNYYEKRNEQLRQKAIKEAENERMIQQKKDDEITETLKEGLIYLKYKFPKADEQLFVKYSYLFFTNDGKALMALEEEIEQSHRRNSMIA